MHRDEQSVWQAGSYSFLTPASTDWYKQNSRPPPSPPPPMLPSFPSLLSVSFSALSLSLPCCLFLAHSPCSLSPPPPSLSVYSYSPSLFLPISPPFFQRPVFLYLHYTQLLPSINYLPGSSLASSLPFSQRHDNNPHYPCIHMFRRDTLLSPPTPLGSWMYLPAHLVFFPLLLLLSASKAHPSCSLPRTRCPRSLGECVCVEPWQEQSSRPVGRGGWGQMEVWEWIIWMARAILPRGSLYEHN